MVFTKASTLIVAMSAMSCDVAAFSTPRAFQRSSSASLMASPVDRTCAIKEAVQAGKTFGPTSQEAKLAWEVVEEIAESDISAAYTGGVNVEECEVTEIFDPACVDYGRNLEEMKQLMTNAKTEFIAVGKNLSNEIRPIKVTNPPAVTAQKDSPELRSALANAQLVTEQSGATSPAAKLAWEALEEQASNDEKNDALGGLMTDECLVEAMEACEAIEELNRAINLSKNIDR